MIRERLGNGESKKFPTSWNGDPGPLGASVLVGGMVDVAHRLDMTCCAIGVETAEQLKILGDFGCDLAQGFCIGAPMPAAKLPQAALADWTAN